MRVIHANEKREKFFSRMQEINGSATLNREGRNQASRTAAVGTDTPHLVFVDTPLETKPVGIKCGRSSPASSASLSRQSSLYRDGVKREKAIRENKKTLERVLSIVEKRGKK